jgi:hypothetical protein
MSGPETGPQVGDRIKVALTGTVRVRHDGKYPSVQIELDDDIISVGSTCEEGCDEYDSCSHARRETVTAFAAPDEVVVIKRASGGVQ